MAVFLLCFAEGKNIIETEHSHLLSRWSVYLMRWIILTFISCCSGHMLLAPHRTHFVWSLLLLLWVDHIKKIGSSTWIMAATLPFSGKINHNRHSGLSEVEGWPAREAMCWLWQGNTSSCSCCGIVPPLMDKTDRWPSLSQLLFFFLSFAFLWRDT